MIGIDPKILLGLVAGFVIVYILLLTRKSEGFSASVSGGSDTTVAPAAASRYSDIVTQKTAPNATNWVCYTYSGSASASGTTDTTVIARIGNDGYVECFNKDGAADSNGCSFMTRDTCSATLTDLVAAGANQKELLAAHVKKYNDPRNLAYSDKTNWLYRFCNMNASVCIKAVNEADMNLVPKDKCASYVPATKCASTPASAQEPAANVKKFGRDATKSKPVLPTPSPSLNIPNLISTVRSLASQITGISTDSAEIKRAFVDAYGSAKTIPADDNNQIMLIYTSYTTFFHYFYSFLDDKNQRIFRNSPFEIQAEMINLINQFDTHTLMVLLLTIDPNYEFETEEEVATGAGAGAGVGTGAGAGGMTSDSTSLNDISSIKESIIQDIKRTLKDVKCPPGDGAGGGAGTGAGAGPGSIGGSGSQAGILAAPPASVGGSGSSSASKAPTPLKDIFGPIGGSNKPGTGECTPTPTCEPAPQACQAPPTSCPVCSGTGCDVCAGSGSPSLGQGAGWYNMLPSNTKPTWTDSLMMWGR